MGALWKWLNLKVIDMGSALKAVSSMIVGSVAFSALGVHYPHIVPINPKTFSQGWLLWHSIACNRLEQILKEEYIALTYNTAVPESGD